MYVLWQLKGNKIARNFIFAALPFFLVDLAVELIRIFFPVFSKDQSTIISLCEVGSVIWFVAYGISSNNQLKALHIEKEKSKKAEEERITLEFLVQERTTEILKQKEEIEQTLKELKLTQAQLIQSEKLASLGELTAGIAHEIQNPLNFVNNFSELNKELLEELKEEKSKKANERDIELETEILLNIETNVEKINFHGNRASSIVKNMLEHARSTSGTKEYVDVNKLCDEYLRLSYHGLRAKDKSFNADFRTKLDVDLPKVNVVTQDFGRVLLNIINNAFYAVKEKSKQGLADFKPMVSVTSIFHPKTQTIEIRIEDNGGGISAKDKEKIFQPFFTTKPTGEGTGLGLSLSREIIKMHGGEIELKTKRKEGTTFIITLPIN
jgi:signal transduction histidine kinase